MDFRNFKTDRPAPGTRILAFSPIYPKDNPMRFRMVTVLPVAMDEVVAYMTERDLEDKCSIDGLFAA